MEKYDDNSRPTKYGTFYIREDSAGRIWATMDQSMPEIKFMDYPLEVDDQWTVNNTVESTTSTNKIISKTATVTIPAGTFKSCLQLEVESIDAENPKDNRKGYQYYCKEIGFEVKEDTDLRIETLISATVNGVNYPK
ncbi:MAG: hypothetical protein HQK65_18140 [Desulfamplus sp.]|nr:hypothetical protein [Desulfamplus sp.]